MLKSGADVTNIIVLTGRTDLRKGVDGLAALIRLNYELDPMDKGTLFLFCGTRRDRIKGLLYEGDGWLLLYKRLTDGAFQWPRNVAEARRIDRRQFEQLMDGFTIESSIKSY